MPTQLDYILNWSDDTLKPTIRLLPKQVDTNSSCFTLYGKGAPNYGEGLQENLLRLAENFASAVPPLNISEGQIWYDSANKKIKLWDGSRFIEVTGVDSSPTQPANPTLGQQWYNVVDSILMYWDGYVWQGLAKSIDLDAHIQDQIVHVSLTEKTTLSALSALNATEIGYLYGLTGNVQTQIDGKVAKTGDTMSGFLTLHANPLQPMHAATKNYIDTQIFNLQQLFTQHPGQIIYMNKFETFATLNQQTLQLPFNYTMARNALILYINGVKQGPTAFTEVSNNTISFNVPLAAGATVLVYEFVFGGGLNTTNPLSTAGVAGIRQFNAVATAGQLTLNLGTTTYTPSSNNMFVYLNGIKQISGVSYAETSNSVITFTSPLVAGTTIDIYIIDLLGTATIRREIITATTQGQTIFTLGTPYHHNVSDPLDVENDGISVFISGVAQGYNDYTETNGISILLSAGVALATPVEIYVYKLA